MKKFLLALTILFAGYLIFTIIQSSTGRQTATRVSEQGFSDSDALLAKAFSNHLTNLKVTGKGVVVRVLPDDNSGTRHQRFIIMLSTGQTVLIAHNIDIGQRIRSLGEKDTVQFSGEYEWNDQGGVIHNTHRDAKGRHPGGWLELKGKRYE
jgi:hypothetical protein